MKKIFLFLFVFSVFYSFSQVNSIFYIADGNDDVNENHGEVPVFNQEYLKLGRTSNNLMLRIGLRYQNVTIPKGSEILSAYIQFTSYLASDDSVEMRIFGEKSPSAAPFENIESEVYHRPVTDEVVMWETQNWQDFIPGPDQRTPDLSAIVQEIIDQDGWVSGNAMHIKMYKYSFGPDSLTAYAYEWLGDMYAPLLQVEYINWSDVPEFPESTKISIYPNPAVEEFNIFLRNTKERYFSISLFDITGKEVRTVYNGMLGNGDHKLQIPVFESGLHPGLYFVSIKTEDNRTTKKILVN